MCFSAATDAAKAGSKFQVIRGQMLGATRHIDTLQAMRELSSVAREPPGAQQQLGKRTATPCVLVRDLARISDRTSPRCRGGGPRDTLRHAGHCRNQG